MTVSGVRIHAAGQKDRFQLEGSGGDKVFTGFQAGENFNDSTGTLSCRDRLRRISVSARNKEDGFPRNQLDRLPGNKNGLRGGSVAAENKDGKRRGGNREETGRKAAKKTARANARAAETADRFNQLRMVGSKLSVYWLGPLSSGKRVAPGTTGSVRGLTSASAVRLVTLARR